MRSIAYPAYNDVVRIAWDLQAVTGPRPTGLGASVKLLLDAVTNYAPEVEITGLAPNQRDAPLRTVPERVWWEQVRLPYAAWREHRRHRLSVLVTSALGAPMISPVPVLAIVNDLIPLDSPTQYSGVAGWYWKQLLPRSWRRCAGIIVSNSSMIDPVAQRLRYPRSRIHVVPYYADPAYQLLASDIRVGYARARKTNSNEPACFLMLSTHEKRKNIELAIRALGILRRQSMAARLVCIGSVTPHTESLRRLAETEGVGDSVEFPGYLDKARIVGMLLDCTALLFVSRFEGYGLPPQDAQSIGCAVVLSDIACHRAVYDDPARWCTAATESRRPPAFIAVDDAQGLAQEMRRLGQDEDYRKQQCQAGLAYQSTFGGQQTADALLAAARTVIQEIA